MSIYSGFATRQIEQTYNIMVEQLFRVMQKRILKFYRNEEVNEIIFVDCLKKLLTQMSFFERQKHLPPKFSDNCKEIAAYLQIPIPSNISVFGITKKNKDVSQNQPPNKGEIEPAKTIQVDHLKPINQQKMENQTLHYGEPEKSNINLRKISHQQSLFSTNSTQMNQNDAMQASQGKTGQSRFRENKHSFITLEAAYNNSSSSVSPNASLHSSLTSLRRKSDNAQTKLENKQSSLESKGKREEQLPSKNETQIQLVKQIVKGQKKALQNLNQQIATNNSIQHSGEEQPKRVRNQGIINQSQTIQADPKADQKHKDSNENSSSQLRVIRKLMPQQQQNAVPTQQQQTQQSQGGYSRKISPSKITAPHTDNNLTLQKNEHYDDLNNIPFMNKKKNKRSLTTKRQRKRNQILNHVYMNGEEFTSIQNGSQTTGMVIQMNQKRSRSSYRSSEATRNVIYHKQMQENVLFRSDSTDKADRILIRKQSNSQDKQIGLNKINQNLYISNNYNPEVGASASKSTTNQSTTINFSNNKQTINTLISDGQSMQQRKNSNSLIEQPSDQTMYSMKLQIVEELNKASSSQESGIQFNPNGNNSTISETIHPRIVKRKIELSAVLQDMDGEPQISKVNTTRNVQQPLNIDDSSTLELKNIFYPFSGASSTKSRTPQRHRILQNSSVNNSFQNTQNTLKYQINQSGAGTDSSHFDQMYKNQSKRQSIQHYPKQLQPQSSSNKKLYGIDSSNALKTSITQLDQSTSDEQFRNNSSFNNNSYLAKKENNSPLKKKVQYKVALNKQQQTPQQYQRNASPSSFSSQQSKENRHSNNQSYKIN